MVVVVVVVVVTGDFKAGRVGGGEGGGESRAITIWGDGDGVITLEEGMVGVPTALGGVGFGVLSLCPANTIKKEE